MKIFIILATCIFSLFTYATPVAEKIQCFVGDEGSQVILYDAPATRPRTGALLTFEKVDGLVVNAKFDERGDVNFVFLQEIIGFNYETVAFFRFELKSHFEKPRMGERFAFKNPVSGNLMNVGCAVLYKKF